MDKAIDLHTHVGRDKDGWEYSLEQLTESMEEAGVTHSVVFPFNEAYRIVEDASFWLLEQTTGYDNLFPFFRFDPKEMTPKRLKENLDKFYGAKLHPRAQKFDPSNSEFFDLYAVISASGKPLLLHAKRETYPYSDPDGIVALAKDFPDLYLVIGHFGNSPDVIQAMQQHPNNIYLETSVHSSTSSIEAVVRRVGAGRLLFGSDAPIRSQLDERRKIDESILLEPPDKQRILYSNVAELLKLE